MYWPVLPYSDQEAPDIALRNSMERTVPIVAVVPQEVRAAGETRRIAALLRALVREQLLS